MPRTVQPSKTRFPHPDYLNAYLFERDGVWHTSVNHKRRTTGLSSKRSNVGKGMEILTERIHEYESGKSGKQVVTEATTTQTALREFLQTKKRVVRADTLAAYIRVFERYLSKPFFLTDTQNIRRDILDTVAAAGLSNGTIHKHLQRLSEYFNYCVAAGFCTTNPLAAIKKPTPSIGELAIPTTDEVEAILQYYRSGQWYKRYPHERESNALLVEFMALTAIRPGEALRLTRNDVNEDGLRIDGKRKRFDEPKVRYIPFGAIPGSMELTKRVLDHSKSEKLFPWGSTQKPASNFRMAVTALNMNAEYQLYSLRAYAKNRWEKELGISFDLSNLLAGHSFAVRRNYVKQPDMDAMKKYSRV